MFFVNNFGALAVKAADFQTGGLNNSVMVTPTNPSIGTGDEENNMICCPKGGTNLDYCPDVTMKSCYGASGGGGIVGGRTCKQYCYNPAPDKGEGETGSGCTGLKPSKCSSCVGENWIAKVCKIDEYLDESTCECVKKPSSGCSSGKWQNKLCLAGQHLDENTCECIDDNNNPSTSDDCTGGRIWNGTECVCPDGTIWDESKQACIPSGRTISVNGQKYCEYLVSLLNTKPNAAECTGSSISSTLTSFSGKIADITLRNGMRLYNVRQNPQVIAELANNVEGGKVNLNGLVVDTNKWGYTVYIDIDGEKGGSEKWVDVYPFYVTLSGMVIPAYDNDNPGLYGGDSRNYLQVSIEDEVIKDGHRKTKWLAKSVSYKEGACESGYVGTNTPYCKNGGAVSLKSECSVDNSLCRLKYVKPIKFFF